MTPPSISADDLALMGAVISRAANLSTGLLEAGSQRQSRLARTYLWAWVGLSLAGLVDIALERRFRRRWIVADSALCVATNVTASTWDGDVSPEAMHYHQMYSHVVTSIATAGFTPVTVASVAAACASWSWGLAGLRRRRPEHEVPLVAATLEPILLAGAIGVVTRHLRTMETKLDLLRDKARRDAGIAATEAERDRQHRLLHDTALQTLEAVAGDWHTDDTTLRALAAADAAQLRRTLDGSPAPTDLESALVELVDTYRRAGLDVYLRTTAITGWNGPSATELAAAVREAMVNALKHAGPATTRVVATALDDEITIDITDDGIGFDTTATTPGFGIEHSIRRRLDKVGGHTEIESAPGQGTTVRLHVPRR